MNSEKEKGIESPLVQSWMLLLGLFWLFRFWSLKTEALWLLALDVYRGDETVDLVTVSLGRDGVLSLAAALVLLGSYLTVVIRYFKRKQVQQVEVVNASSADGLSENHLHD